MICSSDNSGSVVVGACVEQNVAGSNLALCFDFFFLFTFCRFKSHFML